jgi:hypothetical protein
MFIPFFSAQVMLLVMERLLPVWLRLQLIILWGLREWDGSV